jgi:hypothetical protein
VAPERRNPCKVDGCINEEDSYNYNNIEMEGGRQKSEQRGRGRERAGGMEREREEASEQERRREGEEEVKEGWREQRRE